MACRWRVAASVGWLAAQPVAVGAQVLGQLEAVARVGGGLGRAQRGRAALQLLGLGRDHGVPGGEQSVDHDPAGGLDGHRQVLGSAVAGQSGHSLVDAGLVVGQRPVIHQLAGVVDHGDVVSLAGPVPSDVHVASSQIGQPWFTARCRGPVAACSLFGPWSGISLKAVTGPRPVGGGGPRAGCHPARGIGRPPTVTEKCGPRSHWPLPRWWTSERYPADRHGRLKEVVRQGHASDRAGEEAETAGHARSGVQIPSVPTRHKASHTSALGARAVGRWSCAGVIAR